MCNVHVCPFSCLHESPMPFLWKSNSAGATSLHIPSSFHSIQFDLCIISLLPYANLAGPKYCSLTNPSFVFSRHTKHQSCFSTHATPPNIVHGRTCTSHTPSTLPGNKEQCETESWLIRTARPAEIWGCH